MLPAPPSLRTIFTLIETRVRTDITMYIEDLGLTFSYKDTAESKDRASTVYGRTGGQVYIILLGPT